MAYVITEGVSQQLLLGLAVADPLGLPTYADSSS